MDVQSGELVILDHSSGYTYADLENLKSDAFAIQAAKNALSTDAEPDDILLQYVAQAAFTDFRESKLCIPVYMVTFENATVVVDAKTGDVLKKLISAHSTSNGSVVQNPPGTISAVGMTLADQREILALERESKRNRRNWWIAGASLTGVALLALKLLVSRSEK